MFHFYIFFIIKRIYTIIKKDIIALRYYVDLIKTFVTFVLENNYEIFLIFNILIVCKVAYDHRTHPYTKICKLVKVYLTI